MKQFIMLTSLLAIGCGQAPLPELPRVTTDTPPLAEGITPAAPTLAPGTPVIGYLGVGLGATLENLATQTMAKDTVFTVPSTLPSPSSLVGSEYVATLALGDVECIYNSRSGQKFFGFTSCDDTSRPGSMVLVPAGSKVELRVISGPYYVSINLTGTY
jgi:hypothetical protein